MTEALPSVRFDSDPTGEASRKTNLSRAPVTKPPMVTTVAKPSSLKQVATIRRMSAGQPDNILTKRMTKELFCYNIEVDVRIENIKVRAILDTGASNTLISPHIVRKLTKDYDYLPYDGVYNGANPDLAIRSQGLVKLPFQIGKHEFRYDAVIADIDTGLLLGADFILDCNLNLSFANHVGKVTIGKTKHSFPLVITKKKMAQWARTTSSMQIRPGEEKIARIDLASMSGRDCPRTVTTGMLEPCTDLRGKGILVPYAVINAGDQDMKCITLTNVGDVPVILEAKTIIGCWVPVDVVSEDSWEETPSVAPVVEHKAAYKPEISRFEQDYPEEWLDEPCVVDASTHAYVRTLGGKPVISLPEHLAKLLAGSDLTNDQHKKILSEFLLEYGDVLVGPKEPLGRTTAGEHSIDVENNPPIRQAPRQQPLAYQPEESRILEEMIESGIVQPSNSPWASPVVLVKKKDGTIRFCVDYRRLNDVTRKDAYPLPRIEACFDSLGHSKWFCTLDLRSGYWQVPMDVNDIDKTAFVTQAGLYEYLVMPFGLTNAPATFERLMEKVLRGLQWKQCLVYIDDIIIFGASFEQTLSNLRAVMDRLRGAGLTCKPKKCEMFKTQVAFLGHVVNADGVQCDPAKTEAIRNWPVPTNLKELRSFLGLAGYYRRFIPHFAALSSPLVEMTKKTVLYHWDDEQEKAFTALKECLCAPPVLIYPHAERRYILDTDASDYGIGAVLSQVDEEGNEQVIAYGSKLLSDAQRNYCTTKKELLAMVYFVKQYRHYLVGRRFLLRTDHASLLWLLNFKDPEGLLARWLVALSSFMPFDCIEHRAGRHHANADALSRIPGVPVATKKCPTTYVGCPSCYPGAETIYMEGDNDLTATVNMVKRRQVIGKRGRRKQKRARDQTSESIPTADHEIGDTSSGSSVEDESTVEEIEAEEISSPRVPKDGHLPRVRPDFKGWALGWDTDYLIQAQSTDVDLVTLAHRLKSGLGAPKRNLKRRDSQELQRYWSQWEALVVIDGLVYRKYHVDYTDDPIYQLLLPRVLQPYAIRRCHDDIHAGHQGENHTADNVRRRFYWPTYRRDVKLHVRGCERCQRSKPRNVQRAPLSQTKASVPMEAIAMDLIGPFDPPTDRGNKYILVISDVFTKFVEAYALPNKEALTCAKYVVDFCLRFGFPQRIHSDRGTEFRNTIMGEVAKSMNVHQTFTTPYRPQSDGLIERFNRTLIKMMKTFVSDFAHATTWDVLLPMLTSAYRGTRHDSTGVSPNLLFFGRETALPVDVLAGSAPRQYQYYNAASYGSWLVRSLQKAHEYARHHMSRAAERQKRNYDVKSSETWKPKLGEWVYYYHPPSARYKLSSPWIGPYIISQLLFDRNVLIQAGENEKSKVVHMDNLKPIQGRMQRADNYIRQALREGKQIKEVENVALSPPETDDEGDSFCYEEALESPVVNGPLSPQIDEVPDISQLVESTAKTIRENVEKELAEEQKASTSALKKVPTRNDSLSRKEVSRGQEHSNEVTVEHDPISQSLIDNEVTITLEDTRMKDGSILLEELDEKGFISPEIENLPDLLPIEEEVASTKDSLHLEMSDLTDTFHLELSDVNTSAIETPSGCTPDIDTPATAGLQLEELELQRLLNSQVELKPTQLSYSEPENDNISIDNSERLNTEVVPEIVESPILPRRSGRVRNKPDYYQAT